ncbi:MAG: TonB family protein [Magnetospirillum sp.]|nr:TonB family protein [Magnetospirillum sp.]
MKGTALSAAMHAITIACLVVASEVPPTVPPPLTVAVAWLPPVAAAAEQTPQPASQPARPEASHAAKRSRPSPVTERLSVSAPPTPVSATAPEPPAGGAGSDEGAPRGEVAAGIGSTREAEYTLGAADTPLPDYPWSARRRGREGRVVVRLHVGADGRALLAEVLESSGDPTLDQAALDTLGRWYLQPALANGVPVATRVVVPIRFELRRQARM